MCCELANLVENCLNKNFLNAAAEIGRKGASGRRGVRGDGDAPSGVGGSSKSGYFQKCEKSDISQNGGIGREGQSESEWGVLVSPLMARGQERSTCDVLDWCLEGGSPGLIHIYSSPKTPI